MFDLKNYLDAQGISQSEFARQMNVSKACVSLWVRRRRMPGPEQMMKIKRITEGAVKPDDWYRAFEISGADNDC